MNKTALKEYNDPKNIIVISNYPTFDTKGTMGNITGVSTYTYNLASQMKNDLKKYDRKTIIFADLPNGFENDVYEKDGVVIVKIWRKSSAYTFNRILSLMNRLNKVDKILVQFEFSMYGGILTTLYFPLFLLLLRLKRKNVTLLLHQVVEDLNELGGHLNIKRGSIKNRVLNLGIKMFFWTVLGYVDKVIVHDNVLKERLDRIRKKKCPVFVIPHGMIDDADYCEIVNPRRKLNLKKKDFIVLSFGFLTWYKGSDWIVEKFMDYYDKTKDDSIKLIIAGGKSANLKNRRFYESYYRELIDRIKNYPNIIHTDFIPNDLVRDYYCAADVIVFPYRIHMSASGPFSLALSYDRPFLISDNFEGILETWDIKEIMHELDLNKKDICFDLRESGDLFRKISELVESKRRRNLLSKFSEMVKEQREWSKISKKFLFVIDA